MSRARDLADVAFQHLIDVVETEDLSDSEYIAFLDGIVDLTEQEIAETEDGMDTDGDEDEDDEDD